MGSIQSPTPAVGPPNDPIFTHLAHLARNSNKVIIRDPLQNLEADNVRFLRDILQFRLKISSALPADILGGNGLIKSDGVYILLSAPSSYQFLVALFAILAVGGAAVLLRMWLSHNVHIYLFHLTANSTQYPTRRSHNPGSKM